MERRRLTVLALLPALLLSATALAADDAWQGEFHPRLTVQRTDAPVAIDGRLDEPAWRQATRVGNFSEHQPGDQTRPPVDTWAMMSYDDDFLYVAFICADDPALVRASFTERDRMWQDDNVILALDPFGDQAFAYELGANPHGIQGDALYSSTNGEDSSYDVVYYSAGRITAEGYQVEMAVPWTSLRFPDRDVQHWRVDFWRNHPRDVLGQYSWAKYDRDEQCWPCQWGFVEGVQGVRPGSGLALLPSLVSGQAGHVREDGTWDNGAVKTEGSFGVTYGISPSVTAEATVNPDFSQVESDAAQIDINTTFALNYPEKRPFFQEGSDLWSTSFGVVHTRSINQPLVAGKLTGRSGRTSFAVLAARDEKSPFLVPLAEGTARIAGRRSDSFLGRYQRTLGEGNHLGTIVTHREHEGGGAGTVGGLDTRLRLDQNHQVEFQVLASRTVEPDDPTLTADAGLDEVIFGEDRHTAVFDGEDFWGHAVHASVQRSARHLSWDLDYWRRSPTFRAENGFEPRNDQHHGNANVVYSFFFADGLCERLDLRTYAGRIWNFEGTKKDEWINWSLWTRLRWAQTTISVSHMRSNETFRSAFYGDIFNSDLNVQLRPLDSLQGGLYASHGHRIARYDRVMGRETVVSAWANLKPVDRILLENTLDYLGSEAVGDGRELFSTYVLRSRLNLQLSRGWSVRLVLQYNDSAKVWDADPLVTFRLNPFSIFYVGSTRRYADFTGSTDFALDGWRLAQRTYFLKLQYLWQL